MSNLRNKVLDLLDIDVEPNWFLPTDFWIASTLISFLLGILITTWII